MSSDFFQNHLFRKNISGIPLMSNSLDPIQARFFVGPEPDDLGPNCLQMLSADDTTSKQRVKVGVFFGKMDSKLTLIAQPTFCSRQQFQILLLYKK